MLTFFKIISGPFSLIFAWWFLAIVLPTTSIELQNSINYGQLGAALGFLGSGFILINCLLSWEEIKKLYQTKFKTSLPISH